VSRWAFHGTKASLDDLRISGLKLFKPSDVQTYGNAPRIFFFTDEKLAQKWAGRSGIVVRWPFPADAKSYGDGEYDDDLYQWETRVAVPPHLLEVRTEQGWQSMSPRRNPHLPEVDVPRDFDKAVDGYKTFHTGPGAPMGIREPRQIGQLPGLVMPARCCIAGQAVHVMYRSDKWEKRAHDYIHEHDAGVKVGLLDTQFGELTDAVPDIIRKVETLYLLGACLGFAFVDGDGNEVEAKCGKGDELYAIPSNRALVVLNTKGAVAKVQALIWGGSLNVIDRGIVG
jgi:hypothetical protein